MQDITYLVRQPEFVEYLHESNFNEPLIMRRPAMTTWCCPSS